MIEIKNGKGPLWEVLNHDYQMVANLEAIPPVVARYKEKSLAVKMWRKYAKKHRKEFRVLKSN